MNLNNKRLILVGASGGIGSNIARALADEGCELLMVALDLPQLQQLAEKLPGKHHCLALDLTKSGDRQTLLKHARAWQPDGLINVFGINQLSCIEDMHDDEIARMINLNLIVPMQICKDMIPLLKQRDEALIANFGSILGSIGIPGSGAYCSSKFGLRGFTEVLRRELADTSVEVVYFAPRATQTALNSATIDELNRELGNRVDTPEWVAKQLVAALKSKTGRNHYLGWPEKFFVRLNSLLPGLVDRAMLKQLPIIRRYAARTH